MPDVPPLPRAIARLAAPQDEPSSRAWSWVHHNIPAYLLTLPRYHHARGGEAVELPERPAAHHKGPRRLDGAVAMAICAITLNEAGAHAAASL